MFNNIFKKGNLPSVGTISTKECSDDVSDLYIDSYSRNLGNDDDSNDDDFRKCLVAQRKLESAKAELLKCRMTKVAEDILKQKEDELAMLRAQLNEQMERTQRVLLLKQEENTSKILAKQDESKSEILDGQKEGTSEILAKQEESKSEVLEKIGNASTDLCWVRSA